MTRPRINLTRNIPTHNYYTLAIDNEFSEFAFNEERAPLNKGKWRSEIFKVVNETKLDLEIGTGNGTHFQHHATGFPERCVVGIELKYKPLIQTIRGALRKKAKNARICRYHALNVDQLFGICEIDDIYIHFPDPWVTPRKPKNRLVCQRVLGLLWDMQRTGSKLDFKTDSREYFLWAMEEIQRTKYKIEFETLNLHSSSTSKNIASENFVTQFENIFIRQGVEINFVRLRKT